MDNVLKRHLTSVAVLVMIGVVAAGGLLSSASPRPVRTLTASTTVMTQGTSLTISCPVTPDVRPVSSLAVSVECPAASSSPSGSAAPSSSPTAAPTPSATVAATPSPTVPLPSATPVARTPHAPIDVTADGQVIENLVIDSNPGLPMDFAHQSLARTSGISVGKFKNVTIRNVVIRGYRFGILLQGASNVVLQNDTITDVDYCGICVFSGAVGQITGAVISNVGLLRTDFSQPGALNNAYGIKFEKGLNGEPDPSDWTVTGGSVTNVPLWQCLNAHEGIRLTFQGMVVSGCPRAFFLAGPIQGATITGNVMFGAKTKPGGTSDIESVLYMTWTGGSITGNKIGSSYPMPFDYQGASTGVVVSGNVRSGT